TAWRAARVPTRRPTRRATIAAAVAWRRATAAHRRPARAVARVAAMMAPPVRSARERHGSRALRGSAPSVAGWGPGPESISTATAVTQTPTTTTQSTTVNTPHRMVTPKDVEVEGQAAGRTRDAESSGSSSPDGD